MKTPWLRLYTAIIDDRDARAHQDVVCGGVVELTGAEIQERRRQKGELHG